ncbi:hypothetical protein BOW35_01930 [Solemya velum gill symbiont]|nr:hypothetical protein BOW19_11100 [Solemya velum gill symbiont]OOY99168.1 hypothetical protein BOW20_11100 [Solemya velum gill symbiont]OOZ01739.1 hypothetical protein BOW21_11180 [Solemya velum gill symbiont]OOZ03653.1 hypothetical protein BOW22_11090 [Solemya velum gill symbiont]OOZ08282.1 hypothetical protein BOW24_11085 [Solemya velum gill symbiont]
MQYMKYTIAFMLFLCGSMNWAVASDIEIPEPLEPWVEWVKANSPDMDCPMQYGDVGTKQCRWAGTLQLDVWEDGGVFSQQFTTYSESWLLLPGERSYWPDSVRLNNEPAVILQHEGFPALRVAAGEHHVSGTFKWKQLPISLALPVDTGIVNLSIDGDAANVNRDQQGKLWLKTGVSHDALAEADRLDLQIHRRFTDLSPMRMEARLILDVSGKQRETLLSGVLLDGFIPIDLNSPLPARLEQEGMLRLQLRPGHWEISIIAYRPGEVTTITVPQATKQMPAQELWSFESQNHLRLVEPEGLQQVDPRQTTLPQAWRKFPAFIAHASEPDKPAEVLKLKQIRRGDPDPEPDRINLARTLWLDFDGKGYTVQDKLSGAITRSWRLESAPDLDLGRVAINGKNQLITRMAEDDGQGVEIRRGNLDLVADGRYEGSVQHVPLGWKHDMNQASVTLKLPPGWEIFSVSGVDNNPHSWIQRWTLLDLFFVLIVGVAVARLRGYLWGLVSLVTLALTWHVDLAPHLVWLYLIAVLALLRVVPAGKMYMPLLWSRNLLFIGLILIAVPFIVLQARYGIYPQLEKMPLYESAARYPVSSMAPRGSADQVMMEKAGKMKRELYYSSRQDKRMNQMLDIQSIDPDANIQTGPGLPNWEWNSFTLEWNGAVTKDQTIDLTLIPPGLYRVIHFLRILLVLLLAYGLISDKSSGGIKGWLASFTLRLPARPGDEGEKANA